MDFQYLGQGMEELQGRVVLEEDEVIIEIPIVVMNLHLVPGQIIPMTVFHAVFQNAIRRCVVNDRMFGIVNNSMDSGSGTDGDVYGGRSSTVARRGALGTLAEIYEFQEESDNPAEVHFGSTFAIKAKGRQRFNVLEVRRQADGNLMAKVRIRPEISIPPLLAEMIFHGTVRYKFPNALDGCSPNKVSKLTDEGEPLPGSTVTPEQTVRQYI
jgi:cereblon